MTQTSALGDRTVTTPERCRRCGHPLDWQMDVVSRHVTSDGETIYSRCGACRLLQIWTRSDRLNPARLVTRDPGTPL